MWPRETAAICQIGVLIQRWFFFVSLKDLLILKRHKNLEGHSLIFRKRRGVQKSMGHKVP